MRDIDLIWVKREPKYFCKQGWTAGINPTPHSTKYTLLNPKFLSDYFEKGEHASNEKPAHRALDYWIREQVHLEFALALVVGIDFRKLPSSPRRRRAAAPGSPNVDR